MARPEHLTTALLDVAPSVAVFVWTVSGALGDDVVLQRGAESED